MQRNLCWSYLLPFQSTSLKCFNCWNVYEISRLMTLLGWNGHISPIWLYPHTFVNPFLSYVLKRLLNTRRYIQKQSSHTPFMGGGRFPLEIGVCKSYSIRMQVHCLTQITMFNFPEHYSKILNSPGTIEILKHTFGRSHLRGWYSLIGLYLDGILC